MKIVKINDNLKINIEMLYSLENSSNENEIKQWHNDYKKYLDMFSKDPPLLPIENERLFAPKYNEQNNENDLKLYSKALNDYIISIINDKPIYKENYWIILSTGLKINVNKEIYNKIDEYLKKYEE